MWYSSFDIYIYTKYRIRTKLNCIFSTTTTANCFPIPTNNYKLNEMKCYNFNKVAITLLPFPFPANEVRGMIIKECWDPASWIRVWLGCVESLSAHTNYEKPEDDINGQNLPNGYFQLHDPTVNRELAVAALQYPWSLSRGPRGVG